MTWWWDNLVDLEPDLYYPMLGAAARYVAGVRFDRERFEPFTAAVEWTTRPVVARGLQGRRTVLLWLKDDAYQWYAPDAAEIEGATLDLDALPRGRWCGAWYDTWTGADLAPPIRTRGPDLPIPTFSRDLALRLHRCPSGDGLK
jgi:hypothetical protein